MLYRIIIKNVNKADIMTMLRRHFSNFTIYKATGVYTDKIGTHIEPALIIEIDDIGNKTYSVEGFAVEIRRIAAQIGEMNDQECVLLQKIETESEMI